MARAYGFPSTIEYLRAMCQLVFEETVLLPHVNPGVLSREEMQELRSVNASMGMMLETVSRRLLAPGEAHHRCPDKVPQVRLAALEAAGELQIPFTTGILIGIGETPDERVDALFAIRDLHEKHGHIQEVIVQNFRAKPDTLFANRPEPSAVDVARTAAVARLILGGAVNLQVPPNFLGMRMDSTCFPVSTIGRHLAGDMRFHQSGDGLATDRRAPIMTLEAGFELRERLAVYREYLRDPTWIQEALRGQALAQTGDPGLVLREQEAA